MDEFGDQDKEMQREITSFTRTSDLLKGHLEMMAAMSDPLKDFRKTMAAMSDPLLVFDGKNAPVFHFDSIVDFGAEEAIG